MIKLFCPNKMQIDELLDEIVPYILKHKVVLISAPTGSGKSLGIAPAIVNSYPTVKIYISVPTVAAAKSLYTRQYNSNDDLNFGYAADRDVAYDEETQIAYITSGHLRRKLLKHFSPKKIQPIEFCDILVLDEIHSGSVDNSINIDLWNYAKKMNIKVPKLVLSSATVNAENPLMETLAKNKNDIYLYDIQMKTFNIDIHYESQDYNVDDAKLYKLAVDKALMLHEMDPHVKKGHFLIFAPGAKEVEGIAKALYQKNLKNVNILRVYSAMDSDDLIPLYEKVKPFVRKIVVATNIAESAITIADVGVVIDTMTEKRPGTSESGGFRLDLVRISQSSAVQRAGRTGRTRPGDVYRLITEESYNNLEESHGLDILTVPIHKELMELLAVGLDPYEVLTGVPHEKIEDNLNLLKHLKLIDNKTLVPTDAGYFVEEYPLSIRNAKIIWDFYQLGKNVFPAIVLAAMIDSYGPNYFYFPRTEEGLLMNKEEREQYAKEKFAAYRGTSDLATFYNIWNQLADDLGGLEAKEREIKEWSNENSFNNKKVKEFYSIVRESVRVSEKQMEKYDGLKCEVGDFSAATEKILNMIIPIVADVYGDNLLHKNEKGKKIFYRNNKIDYSLDTREFLNLYGTVLPGEKEPYYPDQIVGISLSEIKQGYRNIYKVSLSTPLNYKPYEVERKVSKKKKTLDEDEEEESENNEEESENNEEESENNEEESENNEEESDTQEEEPPKKKKGKK